jgi:hypothetical protein
MIRPVLVCVAACALTVSTTSRCSAQEIPQEAKSFLERLAGEWEILSTLGEKRMKETLTAKMTRNGEGLIWQWGGTDIDSGQVATSVGLMGWDGEKGVIVENMISSNGVTFTATWSGSNNRWVSPTRNTEFIDGEYKTASAERVMEWESDDKMIIVSRKRLLAGKPQPNVTSVFTRKK